MMIYEKILAGRRFEFALDSVDRVGEFLEVEFLAEKADLQAAQDALSSLCAEIGLDDSLIERKSYLGLLLDGSDS